MINFRYMNKTLDIREVPVYYINLDHEKEKRKRIESMLKEYGFKHIHRFPGILETPKALGVAKSFHTLLSKLEKTDKPFIILEDDVDVFKFEPKIKIPKNADAYYLGISIFGIYRGNGTRRISIEQYDEKTFRLYNMLAAHAILYLNNDYVKFIRKAIEFSIKIKTNQDKARAETMKYFNIYASKEPVFYQTGRYENVTKFVLPSNYALGPQHAYFYR